MWRFAVLALLCTGCDRVFGLANPVDAPPLDGLPADFGLIAHYRLDSLALGATQDDSALHPARCAVGECPTEGEGHDATEHGLGFGIDTTSGKPEYLTIAAASDLQFATAYTIALWVQWPLVSEIQCPIGQTYLDTPDNAWQLCIEPPAALTFFSEETARQTLVAPHALSASSSAVTLEWHHIALVRGIGTKVIYFDGSVLETTTLTTTPAFDASASTLVGADKDADKLTAAFTGRLDDLRIYNRALDGGAILALFSAP